MSLQLARRGLSCREETDSGLSKEINMSLLTLTQINQLIANGIAQRIRHQDGEEEIDFIPVAKLFTPDANATWLLTEADADNPDRLFGLCDLGLGCPELGYVSLTELSTARGQLGLPIERDTSFVPDQTLSDYAATARLRRRIVT
jgi:Protein of unknown function (DUF2958)